MRLILDLHQRHKDKPIWIAGSGPSLDEYPENFLDSRLSIALHLAYLKFPKTTYRHANEYDRVVWFKKNCPEYFRKENIFAYPFYKRTEKEMSELLNLDCSNYYFFILRPYPKKDLFTIMNMVDQVQRGLRVDFGGHGSCLHAAIYVAIMMGCNPINIIGCNHEPKGDLEHFKLANDNNEYRAHSTSYSIKGKLMREGTELLIRVCKTQEIKINWIKSYA